jgi:hypothetical protein
MLTPVGAGGSIALACVRVRNPALGAETVGPPVLHCREHRYCKDDDKAQKTTLFFPQMHEEQYAERRLKECQGQLDISR